jgi:hypothetical protein
LLENPLAEAILAGRFQPGDTVLVQADAGAIRLERKPGLSVAPASTRAAAQ